MIICYDELVTFLVVISAKTKTDRHNSNIQSTPFCVYFFLRVLSKCVVFFSL